MMSRLVVASSEKFIEAHSGKLGDISIYGQESNYTTWRLAKMNLAIRGIDAQIGHGDMNESVLLRHLRAAAARAHRFPMAKYRLLRERLSRAGVLGAGDLHVPDAIGWDDLRLVHDAAYVDAVATGTLPPDAQRRIGFPWSPMMVERSRRSVGATLAAAREVARMWREAFSPATRPRAAPQVSANLAGGTHHAFRDRGEGYCVFNDVAVAATVLLREGAIARAAVVDCDVHQGNGTAAIFRRRARGVHVLAARRAATSRSARKSSDLDVTFDDGAGDDEYLAALAAHLPRVLDGAPARSRVLSRRRRPLRRRSARPAEAHHRRACARAIAWCSTRAASAACRSPWR